MEKLPTSGFYYVPTPPVSMPVCAAPPGVSARAVRPYAVLQYTPPVQRMIVESILS